MEPWRGFMNHAESMKRSSGTPCTSSLASRRLTVGGGGVATLLLGFRDRRRARKPCGKMPEMAILSKWKWRDVLYTVGSYSPCGLRFVFSRAR